MFKTYRWYPVRCCCVPNKILGFLRVAEGSKTGVRTLTLPDMYGERHKVEVRRIQERVTLNVDDPYKPGIYASYKVGDFIDELAIYSDDRTVEFWRKMPHFMEVAHA